MNIINKILYGKQDLRYSGSIVVEMGNNNRTKTERDTPHNNNVAGLLQPHLYYSNDSKLRYSNY